MVQIAPIILTPQTAPQASVHTAGTGGSDLSFGALLEKMVSSGTSDAQPSPGRPVSPQKIISSQTEPARSGVDTPPAQPDSRVVQQNILAHDLNAEINGHALTLPLIPGELPEIPQDIKEFQPAPLPVPEDDAGRNLPLGSSPENMAFAIAAVPMAAAPLTSTESLTRDRQITSGQAITDAPAAAAESEKSTPAGIPSETGILPEPERASPLPVTERTVIPADAAKLPHSALSDTIVLAAAPDVLSIPISSGRTISAVPPRDLTPPVMMDPAVTGFARNSSPAAAGSAAPGPAAPLQSYGSEKIQDIPVNPDNTVIPDLITKTGTGPGPDLTGTAGLKQNIPAADVNPGQIRNHFSGMTGNSADDSVTAEATTPPVNTGREPRSRFPGMMSISADDSVTAEATTPPVNTGRESRSRFPGMMSISADDSVTAEATTPPANTGRESRSHLSGMTGISADDFVTAEATTPPANTGREFRSHFSGMAGISASYSMTAEATTPPANTGRESIVTAQPQELMYSSETGKPAITLQSTQADPLEHLARLTPSLQVATLADSAAVPLPISGPQTEMTPLIASFNQLTSLKTPAVESAEKVSPAQQESFRQEVRGQVLEAKIETRDKGADNQGQQPGQQNMATDAKLLATPLAATGTNDQSPAFFQLNQAVMGHSLPQHATVPPAPVTPPPGAPIADDFIFNQVAERFQLHTRNQETQLHIKLHPAELGELKIDLSMKEGSIRAHIVAQSGQVQEVLEKNMVRLKSILEGQGFTIEEILVSIKTEEVGNYDLQQDNLSRGNTTGQQSSQRKDAAFDDTYERVAAAAASPATGVNITA